MRVGILNICGVQLHDRIIALRQNACAYEASFFIFIEVYVPNLEGEWSLNVF